jgi:hypothetical protein
MAQSSLDRYGPTLELHRLTLVGAAGTCSTVNVTPLLRALQPAELQAYTWYA